jgi:hypothetical protein
MPISQKTKATPTSKAKALGNKESQKPGAYRVTAAVCLDNPNLVIDGWIGSAPGLIVTRWCIT